MADTDNITRGEYERRHKELADQFTAQIARLDARIDKAEQADSSAKVQLDAKFDKLSDKIDATERLLSTQLGALKDDIFRTRTSDLWRVLGWGISFVLGDGGLLGALQLFHLLK